MGFILSIIAYVLFFFIAIANFIVVMYKSVKTNGFLKTMNSYWYNNAFELDIFANVHFKTLWNTLMRKAHGYNFGKENETISSALGKNQRDKTLSWFGWVFVIILWVIDVKYWRKGGHCINSIM
ncbi:hypothetical protein Harreka1_15 [Olleya phage Harreka_1]|uniref:Uncharacterized protein n=1 Tax=Olleya phage Harreka_1 TaxID=2745673 RepID=A0A8E4ZLQ4_9CAUD|nr:hypothetical protein M1M26_gp15 [Olleya phage Harreka_1]QQV90422.1 hypothetical protein Harreka1_15 [Olleya phage Harreka_1]